MRIFHRVRTRGERSESFVLAERDGLTLQVTPMLDLNGVLLQGPLCAML